LIRPDTVRVKGKDGGAVSFSAGEKYGLKIAAGGTADKWMDGSPITRAEFEAVLKPHAVFEIAEEPAAAASPQKRKE
jgi:hypothetical protein